MTKIVNSKYLKKGNHLVLLYNSTDEMIDVISEYIIKSLKNDEKVIYIDSLNEKEILINHLIKQINIKKYINRGQLLFLEKSKAYSESGEFIPDKMIALLQKNAKQAISEGYNGIAITGELSWVLEYDDGIERIIEYEWKLNERVFGKFPVSAICRYNMNHFSNHLLINIIQLHPYLIYKNQIQENPFYLPCEAYKEDEIYKYQLKKWLKNIFYFNSEKDRLRLEIEQKEKDYNDLKEKVTNQIIISVSKFLELHDDYTHGHMENVGKLAKKMAIAMDLDQETTDNVYYAGLIHDIGKTIIPTKILNKKGPLTDEEYALVKKHPKNGYDILNETPQMAKIAKGVLYHHERWDGKGYPDGLAGKNIPLIGRILAVADAYDAMVNDRPYRKALNQEQVRNELINGSNKQFDPKVIDILLYILKETRK